MWHLGPLPIHAYALCIIAGILFALWLGNRRWKERGGNSEEIWDIGGWAILFGIIGGRLYHLISDPELYFEGKPGTNPLNAFKIWDGGLGIWGAIALGAVGAWIGCRRKGASLAVFADAVAPGVLIAQAIGRWGNWFNNELYGGPTSLPWGLKVHCMNIVTGHTDPFGTADGGQVCHGSALVPGMFQPTFLYECVWDVAIGLALIYIDRRLRLGRGNVMALYVMGYTAGRGWIEALREDHANHILGLRLNIWTSIFVFVLGLVWFLRHDGFHARREASPYPGRPPDDASPDSAMTDGDTDGTDTDDDTDTDDTEAREVQTGGPDS